MRSTSEPSENNLEELLAYDDIFFDYFNAFLSSLAFPIALYYDRLTGTLHECEMESASARQSSQARYGASDDERERVLNWVKEHRLGLFNQSQYFLEYKLCKKLVRSLDTRRLSGANTSSGIRGYSRQTETESESSISKNTIDSSDYDGWPEIRYSAFKYLRPGSRAFSLPINMSSRSSRDNINETKYERPFIEPKSILKSGAAHKRKSSVRMEVDESQTDTHRNSEAVDHLVISSGDNRSSSPKHSDDEDRISEYNSDFEGTDEEEIEQFSKKTFSTFNIDRKLKTQDSMKNFLRTTAEKRRTTIHQLKEEYLGSKEGMDNFKSFLKGTVGHDMVNFWLDCESFKDEFEGFEKIFIENKQFRFAFKELFDKYKYKFASEAKLEIEKAADHDKLSYKILRRIQYDVLRRIRSYWVSRFLVHKERVEHIRVPSVWRSISVDTKSKFSSITDYELEDKYENTTDQNFENREGDKETIEIDAVQDFSVHPYLDVSRTLPLKPDSVKTILENPLKTWSIVYTKGKSPASRVKSGIKRTTSEWEETLKVVPDRFLESIKNDKNAGGPFLNYLKNKCLKSDSSNFKENMLALSKFLFWSDINEQLTGKDRSVDRSLQLSAAWTVFNKYFNKESQFFINADQDVCNEIKKNLINKLDKINEEIFLDLHKNVVNDLKKAWHNFNKSDVEIFVQFRGYPARVVYPEYEESIAEMKQNVLPYVRRYPGSTESQFRRRIQREKLRREREERELEALKNSASKTPDKEELLKKEARKAERELKKRRRQQAEYEARLGTLPFFGTIQEEDENVNDWTTKGKQKKKAPTPFKELNLKDILKRQQYLKEFKMYCSQYEQKTTQNYLLLYCDLQEHFGIDPDDRERIEESTLKIVKDYMQRLSEYRVDLPRKIMIREVRPSIARLQSVNTYIEPILEEAYQIYKDGRLYLEQCKSTKRTPLDGIPNTWKDRAEKNGLGEVIEEKTPAKIPATAGKRKTLIEALSNPNNRRLRLEIDGFMEHLRKFMHEEGNPLLPMNLLFLIEVKRLEELVHQDNDDVVVNKKVESMVGVFIDSQIEPRIQIDITPDLAAKMERQAQTFIKTKSYNEITHFKEAFEIVLKKLLPYWTAFTAHYKPPHIENKSSTKMIDHEMEVRYAKWARKVQTPALTYSLPDVKPPQSQFGSAMQFSIADGVQWKEFDFTEPNNVGGFNAAAKTVSKAASIISRTNTSLSLKRQPTQITQISVH